MTVSNTLLNTLPQDIALDAGLLYIGNTPFGVSRGGLKFDPGKTIDNTEFDGKRAKIMTLDRVTMFDSKITGKFLQFSSGSLSTWEAGGTANWQGSSPWTGSQTPVSASAFLGAGSYITNLRLIFPRGNPAYGYVQVRFPKALCTAYSLNGTDPKEAEVDATFEARQSGSTTGDDAPYIIEQVATLP